MTRFLTNYLLTLLRFQNFDCALTAVHAHTVAGLQAHGGIVTAHHRRNTQFTRYDRGMGKRRSNIGHDRRRLEIAGQILIQQTYMAFLSLFKAFK